MIETILLGITASGVLALIGVIIALAAPIVLVVVVGVVLYRAVT